MIHMKDIIVPAVPEETRSVEDHVTCDLCKKIIRSDGCFNIEEVIISHRFGNAYPGCGSTTTHRFDLCPVCFQTRLKPWMQEQGAALSLTEEEW